MSEHRPAHILVTGGAGFIGANFVHYLLEKHPGNRVTVLDALTYAGNRENLGTLSEKDGFRFVHGDIRDPGLVENLLSRQNIDTIVHFAAESHVDRSIHGPDAFIDTNVTGTHTLLQAARKVFLDSGTGRPHRFHHVSTDEVYGTLGPDDPAFTEDHPYRPNSPYAASKAGSDHLVRAYNKTYGLSTTISNCSNNYGPFQFPEKLIPLIITNILESRPLPVYGDGLQIRDWLFADDHNAAIDLVIRKGTDGETYNIGGNNEWANIDIVRHLCRLLDEQFSERLDLCGRFPIAPHNSGKSAADLVTHVKDRPGHDRRYAVNADRIRHTLGFVPSETFESGIKKTVRWYLENEAWWRRVMDGSYRQWIRKNYNSQDR